MVGYVNPLDAPPPPLMAGQVFLTGVELNLTALVESGLVGHFVLQINGEDVAEEEGPTFTYIFERVSKISCVGVRVLRKYSHPLESY